MQHISEFPILNFDLSFLGPIFYKYACKEWTKDAFLLK